MPEDEAYIYIRLNVKRNNFWITSSYRCCSHQQCHCRCHCCCYCLLYNYFI